MPKNPFLQPYDERKYEGEMIDRRLKLKKKKKKARKRKEQETHVGASQNADYAKAQKYLHLQ